VLQGKPMADSQTEMNYGASFIEWFSEEARRIYGDTIPSPAPTKRMVTIRQPVGVAAMITPVCIGFQGTHLQFSFGYCLQCFDAVGWVAGRASGL